MSSTRTSWRKALRHAAASVRPIPRKVADLLRQVVRVAQLVDQLELRLEPVGVPLFAGEDVLEQVAGAVVAVRDAERDAAVEPFDRVAFELQRGVELLARGLTDAQRSEPLQ